jgi:hypothetical protein
MSTLSRAENIAHTAMYTYKGGEQNFSPGTTVFSDTAKVPPVRVPGYKVKGESKNDAWDGLRIVD